MPKLPTLQKDFTNRFEGNTSGYNAMAQGISSIAKGLMDMASLTKGIQDIEDKTNANKELVDFKLQATRKADELALKFENDPDTYLKEYNNFLTQSKDNLLYNTKVSVLNKGEYKTLLDSSLVELEEIGYKNSNNLKIKKATNDIKDIAGNLNELSYKYGKDGDLEQFDTLQNSELSKLEESSLNIIPQSQRQAFFDKAKKDNYINFLQGRIVVDPELAIQEIDSGVYNDKISEEELDKMRAMANKLVLDNQKDLKNGIEASKLVLQNENKIRLDSKLNFMDVKNNGEIKNSYYNNVNSILDFNLEVEASKDNLRKEDYQRYKIKIYDMIANKKIKYKGKIPFVSPTAMRQVDMYFREYTPSLEDKFTKSQLYLDALTQAKMNNIDLDSNDTIAKQQALQLTKQVLGNYYDIDPTKSDFESTLKNKVIQRNNELATNILNNASVNIQKKYNNDPDGILK